MVLNMKVNGILKRIKGMGKAVKYGLMEVYMKGIGRMIRLMAGVD